MIWLPIVIVPVILFVCEWLFWWKSKDTRYLGIVFGSIILFVGVLITVGWTTHNYISYPQHRAFYEVNAQNYAIAVDETSILLSQEKYISETLIPIEGSIEKMELAKVVSERIKEWRDAVNEYNKVVASLQFLDNTIFFDCMIPDEVHSLGQLSIGQ